MNVWNARVVPHCSTSAHSSSQIHPNKIWITVFGWHAALAIVINVSSVEAESRLMNDLLATVCAPIKSNWMWYYKATNRYLVKREFEKYLFFFNVTGNRMCAVASRKKKIYWIPFLLMQLKIARIFVHFTQIRTNSTAQENKYISICLQRSLHMKSKVQHL